MAVWVEVDDALVDGVGAGGGTTALEVASWATGADGGAVFKDWNNDEDGPGDVENELLWTRVDGCVVSIRVEVRIVVETRVDVAVRLGEVATGTFITCDDCWI